MAKRRLEMVDLFNLGFRLRLYHSVNIPPFHVTYSPTGASYGDGVYFATEASYSLSFSKPPSSKGEYSMFLAKVLVGKYTPGEEGIKTPPPIDPSRRELLYDSVVDSTDDPTVFVVFYDDQCYPEYLFTFKR